MPVNARSRSPGRRPADSSARRIVFIDVIRATAALAVFYAHIEAHFLRDSYGETPTAEAVTTVVEDPLGLEYLGYGQVAVCLFFLVSGFVVTPLAVKFGTRRFAVNRLFRVFPLLVAVVLLSVLAFWLGWQPLTSPTPPELTVGAVLSNLTLVTFSVPPFQAFVGVAWTLAVEVIFYLLLVAVLPLFRRWTWLAIAVELEVVFLALLLRNVFGPGYDGVASQFAYLLLPIAGQVIWAAWSGKLRAWMVGISLASAWLMLVWASHDDVDVYYALLPAPAALAVLIFTVGLGIEPKLKGNRWWTAASERSYSLYLTHGLVGLPVMYAAHEALPLPITLALGVVATALAVQLIYLAVERPSHQLGRRLSGHRAPQRPRPRPRPRHAATDQRRPDVDPFADTQVIRRPRAGDRSVRSRRP